MAIRAAAMARVQLLGYQQWPAAVRNPWRTVKVFYVILSYIKLYIYIYSVLKANFIDVVRLQIMGV